MLTNKLTNHNVAKSCIAKFPLSLQANHKLLYLYAPVQWYVGVSTAVFSVSLFVVSSGLWGSAVRTAKLFVV